VRAARLALEERDDIAGALLDVRLRDGSGVDLYWWIAVEGPGLAQRVAFVTGSARSPRARITTSGGCFSIGVGNARRTPPEVAEAPPAARAA
jgi:hypothetical protein